MKGWLYLLIGGKSSGKAADFIFVLVAERLTARRRLPVARSKKLAARRQFETTLMLCYILPAMPKRQKKGYQYHPLGFVGVELSLGSHLCCFYEDKEQQFSVLRPFLAHGIRSGQKCINIGTSELSLEVKAALANEFSLRDLLGRGALEFLEEVNLRVKGEFDAKRALRFIHGLVTRARKEGWPSCRIAVCREGTLIPTMHNSILHLP